MTNLTELIGLRLDLQQSNVRKVYYFHENQLSYPVSAASANSTKSAMDSSGKRSIEAVEGSVELPAPKAPRLDAGSSEAGTGQQTPTPTRPAAPSHAAPKPPAPAVVSGTQDFQFGWAQVLSSLSADAVVFNSHYNRASFLSAVGHHLRRVTPSDAFLARAAAEDDASGSGSGSGSASPSVASLLRAKAFVLHFPVRQPPPPPVPAPAPVAESLAAARPLHLVWNHRWEYDKHPQLLFEALSFLRQKGLPFRVSVLGERFAEAPACFEDARGWLEAEGRVAHWGFLPSKTEYWAALRQADVVLSTALHEFFGVSVVEAAMCGCFPLCPCALSYKELFAPTPEEAAQQVCGPTAVAALAEALAAPGASAGSVGGSVGSAPLLCDVYAAMFAAQEASAAPQEAASKASAAVDGASGKAPSNAPRPAQQRQARYVPYADRPDVRKSPFLYATPKDLKQKLFDMARDPQKFRQQWQGAAFDSGPAPQAASVARMMERFGASALWPAYRALVGAPEIV
jgi:hypothetical protein